MAWESARMIRTVPGFTGASRTSPSFVSSRISISGRYSRHNRPFTAPQIDIHRSWQQPDNDFGLRSSVPHVLDSELTHPGESPAHFRAFSNGSPVHLPHPADR